MAKISCTINGSPVDIESDPDRAFLEVLREGLGLTGAKYGCGEGSCRSCTVLVAGRPVTTCQLPVSRVAGKDIVTIEGLAKDGALHPVQDAFVTHDAMQCGYCVPGMILTAEALLRTNPVPSRDEIVKFMNGNICRCCNYPNILRAIESCATAPAEASGQ